jgi:BirA family biotin operon repressor/biotin-[acetyl-CoA-carboxylase] ligase
MFIMKQDESNNWLRHYNLLIFDQIDSTNEEAKRLVKEGVCSDFVIWAKSQTGGRGRSGRNWVSNPGNLYLSILLFEKDHIKYNAELSFVVAVAIGEMLYKILPKDKIINYKWPNDVLINDKKISGILLESLLIKNSLNPSHLIIGVGINVESTPLLKNQANYLATSLFEESIEDVDVNKVIDEFMKSFICWLNIWEKEGFSSIRKKWLERCKAIDEVITVVFGNNRISGIFKDITESGALRVILAGGQEYLINSGEFFYNPS